MPTVTERVEGNLGESILLRSCELIAEALRRWRVVCRHVAHARRQIGSPRRQSRPIERQLMVARTVRLEPSSTTALLPDA